MRAESYLFAIALALLPLDASASKPETTVPGTSVPAIPEPRFLADSLVKRFDTFVSWCSPEKLYLHVDRAYYAAGESIWFSGYIGNATPKALLPTSNYIYVELLTSNLDVVERVKIKKTAEGGFPGCMELPENIESGWYTLRAYTIWQMNSSPEYMFHQRVKILGASKSKLKEKEGRKGTDVSFYPEGGRYYCGMKARMGLKVLDKAGRSVSAGGWLVDSKGSRIASVAVSNDGMSAFEFFPIEGEKYSVDFGELGSFPVPAPSTEGATLSVNYSGGNVYVGIGGPAKGSCHLVVRDLTYVRLLADTRLDGTPKLFRIAASDMAAGINQFLLLDDRGGIVSSRLFYVFGDDTPVCTIEAGNDKPRARELLRTNVFLSDKNGKPLDGRFSVCVVRGSFRSHMQDQGIVSFLGLTSELKGSVNDPDHYFDTSVPLKKRKADMDLLMMIQGWTYYDVPQFLRTDGKAFKIKHFKEYVQTAKVKVERLLSSRIPKNYYLNIFIPRLKYFDNVLIDKAKYITLDSLDFEEGTQIVLNVERPSGGLDYVPRWNGDKFAKPYRYSHPAGEASTVVDEGAIPLDSEVAMADTLSAAVVTASASDVFDGSAMGRSASFSDLVFYKDRSLVEYVSLRTPAFMYNGENMVNRRVSHGFSVETPADESEDLGGTLAASDEFSTDETGLVKLVVDGNEEPWFIYENICLEDISAINISTQADATFGSPGGLVQVKLKSGANFSRASNTKPSLLLFVPLGKQVPRYFYSPRYDRGDKSDDFDHRHTIFWDPCVKAVRGLASLEFCNTDQMDYPYLVRIEGVTSDGRPFSCHTTLEYK